MKRQINSGIFWIFALSICFVMIGCASGPNLGSPTPLQRLLNQLPEIEVAGKDLKFEFGGDTWIARVDGKNYMAGTFTSENTNDGVILTLKPTHIYSTERRPVFGGDVGWVKTSGTDIVLEYKEGPPETLRVRR